MGLSLERNTQVNFKTNDRILKEAKQVFARKNLDLTTTFNLFLQNVVAKDDLPFETVEDEKRELLITELQKEIATAIDDFEIGKGIPELKARERFGL